MGEHGVRDVGLQGSVDEIHQRLEGSESVPEGECRDVGVSFRFAYRAVVFPEPAVSILEQERMLHRTVHAGVESLPKHLVVTIQ